MFKKTFIILFFLLPLVLGISQNGNARFDCSSYFYNNNPLVISSDTVISGNIRLNRDIVINQGVNVIMKDSVYLGDSVHIIVNAGAVLELDTCVLTSLCDDVLWEGIILKPSSSSTHRAHLIAANSIIENADTAVYSDGHVMGINYYAGYITAVNTSFINNKESVDIFNDNGNVSNGSEFTLCSFTINDYNNLDITNVFYNHVKLANADGICFYGCTFNNLTDTLNTGTYRGRGIYALSSRFTVDEYCGSYSNDTVCECNTLSQPSVFERMGSGIEATTNGTNKLMTVQRSNFICNGYNIKTSGLDNYIVTHCDFYLHRYYTEGTYGIHSSNCTGYTISENNFECLYHLYQNYGIYVFNSGTEENVINNNSFYRLLFGIYCDSINGTSNMAGKGLEIMCNSFVLDDFDIYIATDSKIKAMQGSMRLGADNNFIQNCGPRCNNIFNHHDGDDYMYPQQTSAFNLYYYLSGDSSDVHFPEFIHYGDNDLYLTNVFRHTGANRNPCESISCINTITVSKTDNMQNYLTLKGQYLNMLDEYVQNDYESTLKNYYENKIIDDKDKLEYAEYLIGQMHNTLSIMSNMSKNCIKAILNSENPDLLELQQWYSTIGTLKSYYCLVELFFQQGDLVNAENVLNTIPYLFSLDDDELVEYQNYVSLYNLKENLYITGRNFSEITDNEFAQLSSIAKNTDGYSAGIAKNILSFHYNMFFDDRELELPHENIKLCDYDIENEKTKDTKINVFPNPFDNSITITSINAGNIIISDLTGRIILQEKISSGVTKLDSSSWNSEMYIVTIITDNYTKTTKIIKN